jgi:hypothetical protein
MTLRGGGDPVVSDRISIRISEGSATGPAKRLRGEHHLRCRMMRKNCDSMLAHGTATPHPQPPRPDRLAARKASQGMLICRSCHVTCASIRRSDSSRALSIPANIAEGEAGSKPDNARHLTIARVPQELSPSEAGADLGRFRQDVSPSPLLGGGKMLNALIRKAWNANPLRLLVADHFAEPVPDPICTSASTGSAAAPGPE